MYNTFAAHVSRNINTQHACIAHIRTQQNYDRTNLRTRTNVITRNNLMKAKKKSRSNASNTFQEIKHSDPNIYIMYSVDVEYTDNPLL